MFEIFQKFEYHLAVNIGNRRASMNHLINVLFETVVSVHLYGLLCWLALRTLFGTAFPEAAEIGRIFVFGGNFW